jgi:hypothetical protein
LFIELDYYSYIYLVSSTKITNRLLRLDGEDVLWCKLYVGLMGMVSLVGRHPLLDGGDQ